MKTKIKKTFWLMLFAVGVLLARESAAVSQRLSYEEAVNLALKDNADIRALRSQRESLALKATQALSPNNPVLSIGKNDNAKFAPFDGGNATNSYQLSWTVQFPGKSLSQSASLRHQSKSAELVVTAKELETLGNLAGCFYSLTVNEQTGKFLEDEKKKADDLLKLLEKKYMTVQAAQLDLLNAKVVSVNLAHDLIVNHDEQELLLTQFRNYIHQPDALDLAPKVPEDIPLPKLKKTLDELRASMLGHRPQHLAAKEQVESAEALVTNASLSPLPDFQLSVTKNHFNTGRASPIDDSVSDDYSFGLGIAIPLFLPVNELSGMAAARRDRDAAQALREAQELSAVSDLKSIYTHFLSTGRELENMSQLVVPTTKSAYDLTLLSYSLGKSDYFRLNEARSAWVQAEKALLAKKLEAVQIFYQLIQQVGCDMSQDATRYACK